MEFDQNRQFLGQCEFPLEIKKKILDFDKKKVGPMASSRRRRVVESYFISFN